MRSMFAKRAALGLLCLACQIPVTYADSLNLPDAIRRAEEARVEMIQRVAPSVVSVFDARQRGGGSGVVIDAQGYGLSNYHVVAEMLETRRGWGGLSDGKLYELEVLGIDPTGDVAMFRLIGGEPFAHVDLGDSDAVRVGDTVLAMGNPFSISEDYTPTVTLGMVNGVHRYQSGVGKNLVYSDCLQVDAAINPGNSGGPLFNLAGEVIGINGRISVNRRGRLNVGFGYSIAANQIKRFLPTLRAGLQAKHGTLQATLDAVAEGSVAFSKMGAESNVARMGIRSGDRLLRFDDVPIASGNQYAGLLGAYPADWPVPLHIERDGQQREVIVRLDAENPKSRRPFAPDRAVNFREIERVLRNFQSASFAGGIARRPQSWKWKVTREEIGVADGAQRLEVYDVSQVGDGPMRMQRRYDDGSAGSLFTATERTVTESLPREGGEIEPRLEVKMALHALYVMQRWLLEPVEAIDLTGVHHVGGDRWMQRASSATALSPRQARDRVLDVLEWAVGEQAWAKFGFDGDGGRLVYIRVRDVLTGSEVTVDLSDHRDIGGIVWPGRMDLTLGGRQYRDVLSDWELTP